MFPCRPHNSYCIHIDSKSDTQFMETLLNMMECYRQKYPGSYIHPASKVGWKYKLLCWRSSLTPPYVQYSQAQDVRWGEFSIVQAELNCLQDLLDSGRNWSYALDLAGSEVMLLTNRELVQRLDSKAQTIYTGKLSQEKVGI